MKKIDSKDRILVTGASGFIGGHLCRALHKKGYSVKAQYRRKIIPPFLKKLEKQGVELVRADLCTDTDIRKAISNCKDIIHVAALASDWGSYKQFKKHNYEATVKLINQAKNNNITRFVYISSVAVHGFGNHIDTTEKGPYYRLKYSYPKTKKMAESYVRSQNNRAFQTVIIRPGNVYGPRDTTTFYKVFYHTEKGIMGYINKGITLTCPIYIDDLTEGIINAYKRPESTGQIYNLTDGVKVYWKELTDFIYHELASHKKPVNLPGWLSLTLAYLLMGIYKLSRAKQSPPINSYRVKQAINNYHFNIEKAERELDFHPHTTWKQGIKKTIAAYLKDKSK